MIFVGIAISSYGQEPREINVEVPFAQSQSEVTTQSGYSALNQLDGVVDELRSDTLVTLKRIVVRAYASPDGGDQLNEHIATLRAQYIEHYLRDVVGVPESLIENQGGFVAWDQLYKIVEDSDIAYKDEILSIIANHPIETWHRVEPSDRWLTLTDSRNKRLMDLGAGEPYRYMVQNIFEELRRGVAVVLYTQKVVADPPVETPVETPQETLPETLLEQTQNEVEEPLVDSSEEIVAPAFSAPVEPLYSYKPLFALKTNLLYNLVLVPNLELEVPIGRKFSLNAEFARGWWLKSNNSFSWQLQTYSLEGRYWLGDRHQIGQLDGWFVGAFALYGYYDFQLDRTQGTQVDIDMAMGLSVGYSKALSKSFNLEFSASAGYMHYDYQKYRVEDGERLIATEPRMSINTIFPLKAKVSLVWKINRKIEKGGVCE